MAAHSIQAEEGIRKHVGVAMSTVGRMSIASGHEMAACFPDCRPRFD